MLGVAVGKVGDRQQVSLHGAGRHSGGRADALDIEDDPGQLSEIAQAGELRHQGDARTGGGGHGTRTRPAGAQHHADRSEFVFCLHDGEAGFAIRFHAVLLHEVDEAFDHRGRRRNGIPGHHGDPGEHRAQGGGSVSVDDDLALGRMHALEQQRILLGQGAGGEIIAGFDRSPVQIGGLLLLGELAPHGLLHFREIHGEQLRHHAHVDHVPHQLAQLGFRTNRRCELVERNRIADDIIAILLEVQALVVDGGAAGGQGEDVFARGLSIHRYQQFDLSSARDVSLFAGADGVPGG